MIGGMFSGHDECLGNVVIRENVKYKEFYGMSSQKAIQKYDAQAALKDYRTSEGRSVLVPLKGPVELTCVDILGGLRSACTYVGAKKLKHFPKRTTFIRVHNQTSDMFK
jgi:GMP reductase